MRPPRALLASFSLLLLVVLLLLVPRQLLAVQNPGKCSSDGEQNLTHRYNVAPVVFEASSSNSSQDRHHVKVHVHRQWKGQQHMSKIIREEDGESYALLQFCSSAKITFERNTPYLVFAERIKRTLLALGPPVPATKKALKIIENKKTPKKGGDRPALTGLSDKEGKIGKKFRLQCKLTGVNKNKLPIILWYKDGKEIQKTKRTKIRQKPRRPMSQLTIPKFQESDKGIYECRAAIKDGKTVTNKATITASRGVPVDTALPCDYCLNGGTCQFYIGIGQHACICPTGFKGIRCAEKDVSSSDVPGVSYGRDVNTRELSMYWGI